MCRIQPPGAAPEPSNSGDSSVFPTLHSQRSARLTRSGGFEPERRPVPGSHLVPGTVQRRRDRFIRTPSRARLLWPASALAPRRAISDRQGGDLPPTCSDGPTLDAPDCIADHDPRKTRADAERKLCASFCSVRIPFGPALRVAFRPSPHPRIRWTVASPGRAIRAHGTARPPPS